MKRGLVFAGRTAKELMRDPLTLLFGIGFPLVLLALMSLIFSSIPEAPQMFALSSLLPGIAVFGMSFISLFSGMLIASDRENSFLMRLFASPMTASEYLLGYTLPIFPVAVIQSVVCVLAALCFGLQPTWNILLMIAAILPAALLFVGFGLLFGTVLNYKQVGGISSIVINVAALLGGTWFDLKAIGGVLEKVSYALPFAHAVDLARDAMEGVCDKGTWTHLAVVLGYAAVMIVLSVVLFRRRMRQ